eukprot:scaffold4174_cov66-Phaeocystis_antarctica.AAC.4
MLRFRTSKTSSNAATDAGIAILKTLSTRAAICAVQGEKVTKGSCRVSAGVHRRSVSHLVESDHLFERRANIW